MKVLSKFFAFAVISWSVACSNAPTETVETKEAEEVAEPVETAASYSVVTDGDEIQWEGYKTYSDDAHTGTIQVAEGEFQVEGENLVGGKFIIDMNSIANNDLPEEGDYNQAMLVGHLRSPDFFAVDSFPTATFVLTKVTIAEGSESGATHMFSGNLTMRGTEKNITFPATVAMENGMVKISTPEFVIDRTQWNVQYGSTSIKGLAKEKLIDNNIKLKVNLEAKKA